MFSSILFRKVYLSILFFLLFFVLTLGVSSPNAGARESERERKIEALLGKMTLAEKVGQMTLLTLHTVSKGGLPFNLQEPHELDESRLREALLDHQVGSIFNCGMHAFPLEQWREIVTAIQDVSAQSRLQIPILYGVDAVHGMNYAYGATLFPHQIGLAATGDTELAGKIAEVTAYEARAAFIPWVFSPSMDVGRMPLHARFFETFGEDTFLTAAMGEAMVRGYQGEGVSGKYRTGATLKHFVGYSMPVSGKDRTPAWIPEPILREWFIPPFTAGIKAGATAVILANCELNGVSAHADRRLITDLLKGELAFGGVVVSDWSSISTLFEHHHVARDLREAVKLAINAGVDLNMAPFDLSFPQTLMSLVDAGEVDRARIDDAVRRVLGMKFDLGLFERPFDPPAAYPEFGSEKFREVALTAARESMTLLKNRGKVLPLSKKARVLVTGFAANSMTPLNGGWTYTWQGHDSDNHAAGKDTILEAVTRKVGKKRVRHIETDFKTNRNADSAVKAAAAVDYVILCLGEPAYAEVFGNIDSLSLPENQAHFARRLAATGKPVILVLTEGRPRVISPFEGEMAAVLLAYLPGNEGGGAIADILFGDSNPSGRLPFTYPRLPNSLEPYDHKPMESYALDPLYPFGHGLSYTTFAYTNLALEKTELSSSDVLNISVEITNTGSRPGREIVQLYVSDLFASVAPPVKRLRGFQKISLSPGEKQKANFQLPVSNLSFIDRDNRWILEPGEFEVSLGGLDQRFFLRDPIVNLPGHAAADITTHTRGSHSDMR
ncbi:MAG: glycoside hydrolase family 3 N-terminal domain-containing protein [Pseudomonadota bacterium]